MISSQVWSNINVVEDEGRSHKSDTNRHKWTQRFKTPTTHRTLELRDHIGSFI